MLSIANPGIQDSVSSMASIVNLGIKDTYVRRGRRRLRGLRRDRRGRGGRRRNVIVPILCFLFAFASELLVA